MEQQTKKEDKNNILKKTTAMNLCLRMMIGGFLVYLAYSIGIDLKNTSGNDTLILGTATVLFAVSGAVVAGWSLYRYIKRDYYDPMFDDDDGDESDGEASEKDSE